MELNVQSGRSNVGFGRVEGEEWLFHFTPLRNGFREEIGLQMNGYRAQRVVVKRAVQVAEEEYRTGDGESDFE